MEKSTVNAVHVSGIYENDVGSQFRIKLVPLSKTFQRNLWESLALLCANVLAYQRIMILARDPRPLGYTIFFRLSKR